MMNHGWFNETYRHKLAANGVRTVTPKNAYYSTKGGYGGSLLGAAHEFGSQKTSIVQAGELGKATLTPVERAGEATEPAAYEEGQSIVPDVKSSAADVEDAAMKGGADAPFAAFEMGGNLFEKQYMAKKGYTAETAPYYDESPGMNPNEVYAFEERTGRKHANESWRDYFKRESTDEVDEKSKPDIVTLPESRKPLPVFAKKQSPQLNLYMAHKNAKVQALSPGMRVVAVPALLGAWSGESGANWLDRKVKK